MKLDEEFVRIRKRQTSPELHTISHDLIQAKEAAFWLPLISLYTGCRLNKGAQILTEDVREEHGIPYILVKPDSATGRSVKDGKRRRVPIHPDLVKMGLLYYVAKMKQEGHVQLFPELKVTRVKGNLGTNGETGGVAMSGKSWV